MDEKHDQNSAGRLSWLERRQKALKDAAPQLDEVRTRGMLDMSAVPLELRFLRPLAHRLHVRLEEQLGTVDLVLTDNRRRMLSSKQRRNRYEVRAHHMFMGCDETTALAVAQMVSPRVEQAGTQRGGSAKTSARALVQAYIRENHDVISFEPDEQELDHRGEHFHLGVLLEEVIEGLEPLLKKAVSQLGELHITWGRRGQGTRSIRFGSYDFDRKLIRIHPALDRDWVPRYFISFIVYHELLHALFPPQLADGSHVTSAAASSGRADGKKNRRVVHTPEFVAMERRFVDYDKAMRWEAANLQKILEQK